MAIIPSNEYPSQIVTSDPGWPHGKPRNDQVVGDGSGTPLEAQWVADLFGWQQALLALAGLTPSGSPDRAGSSQYMIALLQLFAGQYVEDRLPDVARGAPTARYGIVPPDCWQPVVATDWSRVSQCWMCSTGDSVLAQLIGARTVPKGTILTGVTFITQAPLHNTNYPPASATFFSARKVNLSTGAHVLLGSSSDLLVETQATYESRHTYLVELTGSAAERTFSEDYDYLELMVSTEHGANALPGTMVFGATLAGSVDRGRTL